MAFLARVVFRKLLESCVFRFNPDLNFVEYVFIPSEISTRYYCPQLCGNVLASLRFIVLYLVVPPAHSDYYRRGVDT
jgi:hypothetical protein